MDEELFRRIASDYVNATGAELRRELDGLDELAKSGVTQVTPSLDRRVFARIRSMKRARYSRITGLIAACIALALLAPFALRSQSDTTSPGDVSSASPSVSAPSGSPPEEAAPSPEYEIIPLSATLPERFSISAVEQDIEKTVYYIEDAKLDDVVMTLQYSDGTEIFRELSPVMIGAYTAYGEVQPGYSLLAFEKDGVLYVLTCEHDLNTLLELSESILL